MRALFTFIFRFALRVFFRRVEVVGEHLVPKDRAVMFVLNHPNALVDPAFIVCFSDKPVSFLAKSTLFSTPVIGSLVRAFDCLPVYRRQDNVDPKKNQETFEAARNLLSRGGSIALFPEGISHSGPKMAPLKTGAARIAIGAVSGGENAPDLCIVPAGLYYTDKRTFRSKALLIYGEPIDVPAAELDERNEPSREAAHQLTGAIREGLEALTIDADEHSVHKLVDRAEALFMAGEHDATVYERYQVKKRLTAGYHTLMQQDPDRINLLQARVDAVYDECEALGLDPIHLDTKDFKTLNILRFATKYAIILSLLGPLAVFGALIHLAPYLVIDHLAKRMAKGEEDMLSTLKLLGAMMFFPATWLVVAGAMWPVLGWLGALVVLCAAPVCGLAAQFLLERGATVGVATRALWIVMFQKGAYKRLVAEQRTIRAELIALAESLQ